MQRWFRATAAFMRLLIAGPSGAGKTTVGRRFAERRRLRFVDLDERIAFTAGLTLSRIFADHGEVGFRRLECAALASLVDDEDLVVALGGGAVGEGLPAFVRWPRVVLMAAVPELVARLLADPVPRPLLAGDMLARTRALCDRRMAAWMGFGLRIHSDGLSVDSVSARMEAVF